MTYATPELNQYLLCRDKSKTIYRINDIKQLLGNITQYLPFLRAVAGCDTTSAVYNQGNLKALRLAENNENIALQINVFIQTGNTKKEIHETRERFILSLYGDSGFETLDRYKHIAYKRSVASTSNKATFNLSSLPPSSAGAHQHLHRVYLQTQEWLANELSPTDWVCKNWWYSYAHSNIQASCTKEIGQIY